MAAVNPLSLQIQRDAEAHLAEMREKLRRELNWDAQERQWANQDRQWYWQRWFWGIVATLAALGIIFRA